MRVMPLLLLALPMVSSVASDEDGYFAGPSTVSWSSADTYCQDNGGHLASVGTQEELDAAGDACMASIVLGAERTCWIGLESAGGNLDWSWTDGSALGIGFNSDGSPTTSVSPWGTNEPNNDVENCVHIAGNGLSSYGWNDLTCTNLLIPICKLSEEANCAAIPIDKYLTSCSDEFAANELDIESLQSAQSAATESFMYFEVAIDAMQVDISANDDRMDAFADAADTMQTDITTNGDRLDAFASTGSAMQTDITANSDRMDEFADAADIVDQTLESVQSDYAALESRLEEIESWKGLVLTFSAKDVAGKQIADDADLTRAVGWSAAMWSTENKDTLIVVLVLANVLLIVGCFVATFAACCGVQRQVRNGKPFASLNVSDSEANAVEHGNDSEMERL